MAWLRRILANQLAQLARHYTGTQQRDINREQAIDQSLAQSSWNAAQLLVDGGPTPSGKAIADEEQCRLADVLDRLAPDYRTVLILRNIRELSHAEVARRMGKSEGAVRVLWLRALTQLKQEFGRQDRVDRGSS
jgi:RNA polymerase sigma-70 factor (ECF subfamily)